ncbi:cyclin-A2-1-like [Bidens hawaiensis]|uniref:cyclin-A2-1-like n=1 Tax=Bidens hawaiensis TaxID=980011 RepID=UPI004049A229
MKKAVTSREPTVRVTRARAAASQSSSSEPSKPHNNAKRSVQDENKISATATSGVQKKRRAVLKDVTNICCDNSYKNCIVPTKILVRKQYITFRITYINFIYCDLIPFCFHFFVDFYFRKNSMLTKKNPVKSQQVSVNSNSMKCDDTEREEKNQVYIDIDSDKADPQKCSLYVCEIYSNLRVAELIHRPRFDFMETVQKDVTQSMRGVLVDWLVEVSVEYKLEPETLYLTVHLIDMFLSKNYIERQKLQLLGITCMLIASKYEETIAPCVDEFCFITDNTYTKSEVIKMESQVLNDINFHLSAPTTQKFLRRFIRAAQASHQSPSRELECLATYLAELTLIDYNFLVFVPSNIAAAAVFLARWMLDQSSHPWNYTLEHYTNYKPMDLKNTICALHGLHLSDTNSPLTVIRSKYKQDKFSSVASFPSRELPETLF